MSLRDEVLDEVENLARQGLQGIVSAAERARVRKEAHPELQAAFHRMMAARLPRWRWLAKASHRALARRWQAKADAASLNPIAHACRVHK